MKILVVGNGGREHALVWVLAREKGLELLCAPGNPGISELATCHQIDVSDVDGLLALARREAVDLTIVGPERPLSLGLVDAFKRAGLRIFGPTRAAAELESSKSFAKGFMQRHGVPTARFEVCTDAVRARRILESAALGYPVVLKADGLAAGKGVVIAADLPAALSAVGEMMVSRRFGAAGETVVLEEFLVGEEASYFVLAAGERFMALSSAQDHKRIFDGDKGPNTGGMGAFAPSPLMTSEMERRVVAEIVRPVLSGMSAEGRPFDGFLYVGLMLTSDGPKVVEFNARFGDPEAQVILPRLEEPLSTLLFAAVSGTLPDRPARFVEEKFVGVVLASAGYPESSHSGDAIEGLSDAAGVSGALVFHAGTARQSDVVVTNGGRVLTVVGHARSYETAIGTAYRAAEHVQFQGRQMRRDIGQKALAGRLPTRVPG